MQIFIRAYGSHLMGMGHLYRIQKIVARLKINTQCHITLFTRKYIEAIKIYQHIKADKIIEIDPNMSLAEELKELHKTFQTPYDVCINDQLNTTTDIANTLTTHCKRNITFDDLGEGNILFDNIINVLYPSNKVLNNEINSYDYLILEDNLDIKENRIYTKKIKTIFINQGAADTWGAIPDMIDDLNKIDKEFKIKVLLGPSFQHFKNLALSLEKNKKQIEIYNFTNNVVDLAKDCDLAILGAGNTLFEIAAMGIPIIASSRETKELITIQRLVEDNIIYSQHRIYQDGLENIVSKVFDDENDRKEKFDRNRKLFNYQGLDKIIKIIKDKHD